MYMFFLALPNSLTGTFFFAEDIAGGPGNEQFRPPKVLINATLPKDRDLVSLSKIKSLTLPHVHGAGGVKAVLESVPGRGNHQYIADGLFALERAFLVPDYTWSLWEERLSTMRAAHGRPPILGPLPEPEPMSRGPSAFSKMSGSPSSWSTMSERSASGGSTGRPCPMDFCDDDPFKLRRLHHSP